MYKKNKNRGFDMRRPYTVDEQLGKQTKTGMKYDVEPDSSVYHKVKESPGENQVA